MNVFYFGEALIRTKDLDPVYVVINRAEMPMDQLYKFLLCYWCTYHVGQSAWASEQTDVAFSDLLKEIAENKTPNPADGGRWPRGKERRHWRGDAAWKAANALTFRYGLECQSMVEAAATLNTYHDVSKFIMEHESFGPWMAFKAADMIDRCIPGAEVDFSDAAVYMFDQPYKAALMEYEIEKGVSIPFHPDESPSERQIVEHVCEDLIHYFGTEVGLKAPPFGDRPINIQEVETILCKHKSHLSGRYEVGDDISEILHGIKPWASASHTASKMYDVALELSLEAIEKGFSA